MKMNRRLAIIGLVLGAVVVSGECKEQKTVVLNCGDTFDATGDGVSKPLRTLANALNTNKRGQVFKVKWVSATPSSSSSASAIYNRKARTLIFYAKSDAFGMGYEGFKPVYEHWRLKRVTDAMIIKLARKHPRDDSDPGDSYFSNLTQLGAKKY